MRLATKPKVFFSEILHAYAFLEHENAVLENAFAVLEAWYAVLDLVYPVIERGGICLYLENQVLGRLSN